MRKLIVSEFMSLDGSFVDLMRDVDAFLLGRRTTIIRDSVVEAVRALHLLVYPLLRSATPHPTGVVALDYARA